MNRLLIWDLAPSGVRSRYTDSLVGTATKRCLPPTHRRVKINCKNTLKIHYWRVNDRSKKHKGYACKLVLFIQQLGKCTPFHDDPQRHVLWSHSFWTSVLKRSRWGRDPLWSWLKFERGGRQLIVYKWVYYILCWVWNTCHMLCGQSFYYSNFREKVLHPALHAYIMLHMRDVGISTVSTLSSPILIYCSFMHV